jgi:hypothetical protein
MFGENFIEMLKEDVNDENELKNDESENETNDDEDADDESSFGESLVQKIFTR